MELQERLDYFKEELDLIYEHRIKEFAKLCLSEAPNYIFVDCPASSTGKHHPLNEIAADGTLIHTKKVFRLCYSMSRALAIESKRDILLCAALLHDLVKRGWGEGSKWTKKDHPQLAAELVDRVQVSTKLLTEEEYSIVRSCVFYHYGPWTLDKYKKPMTEFTLEELCVYLSDYVASKKFLDVSYRGEFDG